MSTSPSTVPSTSTTVSSSMSDYCTNLCTSHSPSSSPTKWPTITTPEFVEGTPIVVETTLTVSGVTSENFATMEASLTTVFATSLMLQHRKSHLASSLDPT
eukprot:UN16836